MTPREAVTKLLLDEHLTSAELHSIQFQVEERAHRNLLLTIQTDRQTLVYKWFDTEAECHRECSALELLHAGSGAYNVPELLQHEARLMLTRTAPRLVPIGERADRPASIAHIVRCATSIASVHQTPLRGDAPKAPPLIGSAEAGPWALDLPPAARDMIRELQAPNLRDPVVDLLGILEQAEPVFSHGDIRSGNLLLDLAGTPWVIDWETAGAAARWHDLGSLLAAVVELAISRGIGPPSAQSVSSILDAYSAATHVPLDLQLTLRCAGARLLQSAIERAMREWKASPHTRATWTVGRLFLAHPLEGAIHLGIVDG